MVCGTIIFLYPTISNYINSKKQIEVIAQYKEKVSEIDEETLNIEHEKAKKYNENLNRKKLTNYDSKITSLYENILNFSQNGIMAYIEIPKISTYLPIYHNTLDEKMKKGIGHIKNTSLPIGGKSTHSVLTGHTGISKAKLFTRLNELEVNDNFYIHVLERKLTYKIYNKKVVLPTELEDLQIVEGSDLITLVTCTPYGINTHRLLVQGERVEEKEYLEQTNEEDIKLKKLTEKYKKIFIIFITFLIVFLLHFSILSSRIKHKREVKQLKNN